MWSWPFVCRSLPWCALGRTSIALIPDQAHRLRSCNWVSGRLHPAWSRLRAQSRSWYRHLSAWTLRLVLAVPASLVSESGASSEHSAESIMDMQYFFFGLILLDFLHLDAGYWFLFPEAGFLWYQAATKVLASRLLQSRSGRLCCSSSSDPLKIAVFSVQLLHRPHEVARWPTPSFHPETPRSHFHLLLRQKCLLHLLAFLLLLSHSTLALRCYLYPLLPIEPKASANLPR